MNGVIDIGNTRLKWAVFEHDELLQSGVFDYQFAKIEDWDYFQFDVDAVIVSSTVSIKNEWLDALRKQTSNIHVLSHSSNLPFELAYTTPDTLGRDRIAAIASAWAKYERACLCIDLGTCVTFDFIDDAGVYHGGAISPGMNMRFKAMHDFTGMLPLVIEIEAPKLIGESTISSMQSGVMNGLLFEIEGAIEAYRSKCDELTIIITGGNAKYFESQIKSKIFVDPNLVLKGLNEILKHNCK